MTITQDSPTTFTIGGLSALTAGDGNYTLTVNATGISDFFGDVGSGSLSTSWATGTDVPVVVSVGAGNPALRNTPVDTVDVVLSEPIVPASFDYQALSLTLNGGPNLITSGVTVTEVNSDDLQHRRPRLPDRRRRRLRPDGERRRAGRRLGQLGRRLPRRRPGR